MTLNTAYLPFTEQDTVDTLILPYLKAEHGFPGPESLDFQAQHTLALASGSGRYDGLYLSGGYPYVVLEAKRYSHDLNEDDVAQARAYATSDFFDKPVPFLIISNGREHRFLERTTTIDPADGKIQYNLIPALSWPKICKEDPGEVRQQLSEAQLLDTLRAFKNQTYSDISALFTDTTTGKLDSGRHPLGQSLLNIVNSRRAYQGETTTASDSGSKHQQALRQAIEAIAMHFTVKILFIKLIEDISRGSESPRIVHSLFPQALYDHLGGLFGYKVLNALQGRDVFSALRLYTKANRYYEMLSSTLAGVTWQDIFRYGFSVHTARFGQLFRAKDYDRFLPKESTLEEIQRRLISIDIRTAVIYGSPSTRTNVIGDIYAKLIDDQLRTGLGAVYTPDDTMKFMVDLASSKHGGFRGKRIVEPACGSGHFYREIYRRYVDQVFAIADAASQDRDEEAAHEEALQHIFGRDIDPFAVQLTLLSTFLEQLRDNVRPGEVGNRNTWSADKSVDTQNSLDPISIDPDAYFDIYATGDLGDARSLRASCKRSIAPDIVIGNPPYGVSIVKGANYDDIYDLQSKDSYGYFIVNALRRLKEGGRLIFIVSSSFLTIGSHLKLRKYILLNSKIVRIIKLHRATFPGIDVFPVIIELEKCVDASARANNVYQFYDLWQLHPATNAEELKAIYSGVLADLGASNPWPWDPTKAMRYTVRQGLLESYSEVPLFEGKPSLYHFMADPDATTPPLTLQRLDGSTINVVPSIVRGRPIIKLRQVAMVKVGLQSGDNGRFYRVAPGVKGGATKGGYKVVPLHQVVPSARLAAMTDDERANGFQVDDPSSDQFFVPLDKSGSSDIDGGVLAQFYRPIEFFVDWSASAVAEMKVLKQAVFRNSQHYFKKGISFSNTGVYSPTFRLGHGGVFDQTGSNIFTDILDQEVLIGILSSTLLRYFQKAFINHGAHAQLEDMPLTIPSEQESKAIKEIVSKIVSAQKVDSQYDYRGDLADLDEVVNRMYNLDDAEKQEIQIWYARHYPNLVSSPEKK